MPPTPNAVLQKTICQIRYAPSLAFYELMVPAARQIEGYADWQTNRLSILLQDFVNRCSVMIAHDSISYEQDNSDTQLEAERISPALHILPERLSVKTLKRIGYRRQYLCAVGMSFADLVSVLNVKLLAQDETLRSIVPESITDMMYRIDCSDGKRSFHVTVGPVQKPEIPRWLQFNREHHMRPESREDMYRQVKDEYPDTAVFFDFDVYQEDEMPAIDAEPFVSSARDCCNQMADRLLGYLFSDKVEG